MIHMDSKVNEKSIEVLKQEYERISEDKPRKMTVNCENIHKYLGINIDRTTKGMCKTTIFDYIKEILETFDDID